MEPYKKAITINEALKRGEGRVTLRGWVYRKRVLKEKAFILLRDSTGVIQLVFPRERLKDAEELNLESSIVVTGALVREPRAPGGVELHVESVDWAYIGEPYPINEDAVVADSEYLLDVRHLWVRSRKMQAVLKIRHTIFGAIHEYFRKNGFYEVHTPMFITAAVEGGATLFKVDYFGQPVYLTQSSQFYLEVLIYSLEKVYVIAPSFRAEPSRTRRHLTEFWHAEMEMAWAGMNDAARVGEELISYVVERVLAERQDELRLLGRRTEFLERAKPPFYRVSYDEAVDILRKKGISINWGDDIGADEERALTLEFDKPIILYGFPEKLKAFYHRNDPKRPEVTLSFDVLLPEGYGEVIGGGERIYEEKELVEKIVRFGLNPKDYWWYIDLRKYGSVPHAGFGLGVDRLTMWITGADHIRDVVPFPRDVRRTAP
ncbi:asparagine--tRNA ligase [Pyrobaculum aerophilum]|uniref:Asparagine--tRNA ligase n=2 Tax=Pyrobaculum aerophilum TaxID=13773 RepID=Q8ZU29_PYRAE|nr:asparagine--tRNA ligase [Pyrobaculum aerophilum]AAL64579.1 asparaginyl-tRNA synthetase [Pyrobaculum aerophilum str. IM2]MCX8137261.1 asparagine--tRNA ligase [Pyrobaculum aerophilum]HII47423.1 asparagine--tRNA ligase [Pyrobaculum aerophilum]